MIDDLLREGRRRVWTPFVLAPVLLAGFFVLGATAYDSLPERWPVHWGADGQPTRFEDRSVGTVFLSLLMLAPTLLALLAVGAVVPMISDARNPLEQSGWSRLRREGSVRGIRSGLGWLAVVVVMGVGGTTAASWFRGDHASPVWLIALMIPACFVVLILAYRHWSGWARKMAERHGIRPTPEEAEEDARWLPLGLRNDPDNPKTWVPKRDGHGTGWTVNVGHAKGRLAAAAVLGLPILLSLALLAVPLLTGGS